MVNTIFKCILLSSLFFVCVAILTEMTCITYTTWILSKGYNLPRSLFDLISLRKVHLDGGVHYMTNRVDQYPDAIQRYKWLKSHGYVICHKLKTIQNTSKDVSYKNSRFFYKKCNMKEYAKIYNSKLMKAMRGNK